jgi:hypothetical protein
VNPLPEDELHWLAFRYVTGELSGDEESSFELRLAEDQQARDAVEQAVELNEAVRVVAAELFPARAPQTGLPRRAATWAVALAACLVVVCGLAWLLTRDARDGNSHNVAGGADANDRVSDPTATASLALQWAALRQQQDSAAPAGAASPWPAGAELTSLQEPSAVGVEQADESIPEWLMIAVSDASQVRKETP